MFEDSVTYLAVLNVANAFTDATESVEALPTGAGGFFFVDTDLYESGSAIASGSQYYFAWRDSAGVLHKSPIFDGGEVSNKTKLAAAALTEQVTYLGYNGSSGSMDVADGSYFGLKLMLNHTFGLLNNSALIKTIPYKTASTSSQADLAFGLVKAGYNAFKNTGMAINRDVKFEVVCDVAASATNDFTNTATIVNGATTFTVASNLTYNTAAGTLAVGDYIRIADDSLNGTLALTDPVYKVTAINTLTVTVDRPIDVPSGAWTDAGDGIQVIPAADAATANFGVRMTGNTPSTFNAITDTPFVVSFDVLSDDFETATITKSTAPSIGTGTYQLVAALEAYTQFQDKGKHISAYPPVSIRIDADSTNTYCIYSFEIVDSNYISATTGINPKSKMRFVIAVDTDLTTDISDFDTVLAVS